MKRIAIGGIHTECSSYSPLQQRAEDFVRTEGEALVTRCGVDFEALRLEPVPLFHDRSVPGGPVPPEVFVAQKDAFIRRLKAALPVDGVLLLMHGAYFVPDVDDPEADFIEAVRTTVGPNVPIAASYDLHGQVSERIAKALDIFAAYRTAPHIDVLETHARAATALATTLHGGLRPSIERVAIPLLVSGEMSSTFAAPCDRLYHSLAEFDRRPGIVDANLTIGYVWADTARATAAAVVTCTDRDAGRRAAEEIAAAYWNARDELAFEMKSLPPEEAVTAAIDGLPAVLADSGDNPTAGGVGDRADILSLIHGRITGALFAGIADPQAVEAIANGAREISVGGSLGSGGPRQHLAISDTRLVADPGHAEHRCAVVESAGNTIVLTSRRRPFHHLDDFAALGLVLEAYPLLVVKSGYLSPEIRTLERTQIMALTDGAVCQDLSRLENRHRPRPTWGFG